MEERPLWVSPAVVFLSYLYQLPEPTPPIGIFLPSFYRNHKASCTTPERVLLRVGTIHTHAGTDPEDGTGGADQYSGEADQHGGAALPPSPFISLLGGGGRLKMVWFYLVRCFKE